jgi:conserved oligomeric Golgi complex subunit 6
LQEQIKALQAEVDESRTALESLHAKRANESDIIAAAEIDQLTLVNTRADLEAIKSETIALKAAQAEALNAANAKINALELEASRAEALATEITSLRAEKEETSNKLSELEVEILEFKEAQELAEEERGNSKAQTDSLRDEVAAAAAATERAVQEAVAKESAAVEHLEKVKTQYEEALTLAQEESKRLAEQLHASQADVDELRKNLGVANAAAASAADEHAHHLAEAEQVHRARQDELTAEFERVSAELAVRGSTG